MTDVLQFWGDYRFLSNFWLCKIRLFDGVYPSVEHAFHAAKTLIPEERKLFQNPDMTPGQSKKLGRTITLRPDWDTYRLHVMKDLVKQKFQDPDLRKRLLAIDGKIVEGNTWGDTIWGECPLGVGENNLGKILMELRDYYKIKPEPDAPHTHEQIQAINIRKQQDEANKYLTENKERNEVYNTSLPKYPVDKSRVFVYGANEKGIHGRGAAAFAVKHFGAVIGKIGYVGNSYGIPTKSDPYTSLTLEKIKQYIDQFIGFAIDHDNELSDNYLRFQLTPIGCGLAGFKIEDIAPMFDSGMPINVDLPQEFKDFLNKEYYANLGKNS